MSKASPLGTFDGRDIIGAGVIVKKTGDGLSETVQVDPDLALNIAQGDEGYIVFEYRCVAVQFPVENRAEPSQGGVKRVIVLDAGTATFLDEATVGKAIAEQAEKNERHRYLSRGQQKLEDGSFVTEHRQGRHTLAGDEEEYCPLCISRAAHERGEHTTLLDEGQCDLCDDEHDAVRAEQAAIDGEADVVDIGGKRGKRAAK